MEFICNRDELFEAVTNVSKAVSDRTTLSVLEGVKFELNETELLLTGYDLEIGIRTKIKVKSSDKGTFVANAKIFSEMVRKMPGDKVKVEIDEDLRVKLESENTFYDLTAMSSENYPALPECSGEERFSMPQSVLKNMIMQTKFAASQLDIKPILKGILFEVDKQSVTLVAIDGYRLAVRKEPVMGEKQLHFIVPAKNLEELAKLLSDEDGKSCVIYLSKKHIVFEIDSYIVNSRLLEGEFHPYKSSIPDSFTTEVKISRTKLIQTLERCLLLISEKNPSPVRCYFEDGRMKVSCATRMLGKVSDEIDAKVSGPAIEIGFKCKYFLDPLKALSDETVTLQLGGSLMPMKIIPDSGDSYLYLVLPVRLPKEDID